MRKYIFIALLLLPFLTYGQNYSVPEPRLRVYRSASLTLSTSWQDIDFNGTSTYNINTYGTNPATGNNIVWYEPGTRLFKVEGQYDRNLTLSFYPSTTTNLITTPATLQMRLVIPNGISPGVDLYIPYPEAGGYLDIAPVTTLSVQVYHQATILPIYASQVIRTNGFRVQAKLSNALVTLGVCTLNNAALVIQSRY